MRHGQAICEASWRFAPSLVEYPCMTGLCLILRCAALLVLALPAVFSSEFAQGVRNSA